MGTTHFGSKTAAPFTKGGGRSKKHPNDAKGKKRALAKAALAKGKGGDYSNLDLAFNRSERRDGDGQWTGGGAKRALAKAFLKRKNRKDPSGGNAALAAIQKRARLDTSNEQTGTIDLGFSPSEPRGTDGRWVRAAMRASTQRERNAVRVGHMADYQSGHTSNEEHSKVLSVLDAADKAAKGHAKMDFRLGQTTGKSSDGRSKWSSIAEPSKPEANYLAAKNKLAQANLSGKPRKIAKAKKGVAKASLLLSQSKNAASALDVAAKHYTSKAHVAATDGSYNANLTGL